MISSPENYPIKAAIKIHTSKIFILPTAFNWRRSKIVSQKTGNQSISLAKGSRNNKNNKWKDKESK